MLKVLEQNMSLPAIIGQPYVQHLQPTHSAKITPYCTPTPPRSPFLSQAQSEITALQPAPPQKGKWMYSPPVAAAERECGRGGKDMATVQCVEYNTIHRPYRQKLWTLDRMNTRKKSNSAIPGLADICMFWFRKIFIHTIMFQDHLWNHHMGMNSQSGAFSRGLWECVKWECDRMCFCCSCDSSEARVISQRVSLWLWFG